ncbi:MAG TPA: hypothetical protein QF518_04445 [Nitrosopumilus sp.]|jgi:hypothetical protein|nr:hypothetical protein [Nitrosopumilus sp.]HJM25804.1 hypothetical protein [Nitrosopumilus sp.]HJO31858.1 hypothetical protein [Nitrosopumilus sp.]|tara:strand:- start:1044 stop:1187 length:144 start_codon:yes stop_codon:yes gene_type:complete
MLYSFELQIMGIILLTAMGAGGVSLWYKRRKIQKDFENQENKDTQNC